MKIDSAQLEATIREVLAVMFPGNDSQTEAPVTQQGVLGDGVFTDMDSAVEAAHLAQREYLNHPIADRHRYVATIREAMLVPGALDYMPEQAAAQPGMDDVGHKHLKNKVAAAETSGVEDLVAKAWSSDDSLTTIEYSSYGVIGAIASTINPTEIVTCNSIGMLATSNAVVLSPHPRVAKLSCWQVRRINRALRAVGAPDNLVATATAPLLENTNAMMAHPKVRTLVTIGGPSIVKAVLSSSKRAIGAGASNSPAVVDGTTDIEHAAKCIVDGANSDNNLSCTVEKEIIMVDSVAGMLKFCMIKHGAYKATASEVAELEKLLVSGDKPRIEWAGKPTAKILKAIGVTPLPRVRLIVREVNATHPFMMHELMMPVLGLVWVPDADAAINLAVELEHGNCHTVVMHSLDVSKLMKMSKLIQTTIFVKNGPSYNGIGIGGEGYPTLTIIGPTGEGFTSARSFTRRRCCVLVGDLNVR